MTKVLILAGYAPSLTNFRGKLIEEMLARHCEVHAAAPSLNGDSNTLTWLHDRGVICHDLALNRVGISIFGECRTLCEITTLMKVVKPDIFLGYTAKPVIWGLLAAKFSGVRNRIALITGLGYSFSEKANMRGKLIGQLVQLLYWWALRQATLVFFQNPDDHKDFQGFRLIPPNTPVKLVNGSGVDLRTFEARPPPQGPIRFLLIARLLSDKGIREYVQAAKILKLSWPEIECHLVGGIDSNPNAINKQEVQSWHNADFIIWHGELGDVREIIAQSHVYVLPSYREGTPRTVLEAMAIGRAVVTTDVPGCRETVKDGKNGFLVPVRDAPALANAMQRFIISPELIIQMGTASRKIAEERFDVDNINKVMLTAMDIW